MLGTLDAHGLYQQAGLFKPGTPQHLYGNLSVWSKSKTWKGRNCKEAIAWMLLRVSSRP
jgi:hypothetical protein